MHPGLHYFRQLYPNAEAAQTIEAIISNIEMRFCKFFICNKFFYRNCTNSFQLVYLFTFLAVLGLDVIEGLAASVVFAALMALLRSQW